MLLVFDVGNTNTVVGLFDNESGELIEHWRSATDLSRTSDEWQVILDAFLSSRGTSLATLGQVLIGSVVSRVSTSLEQLCTRLGVEAMTVTWRTEAGIAVHLENPSEMGADRLANAVAAKQAGKLPAIVVDMGTATTLDVISSQGDYLGGVILPGLGISMDALFDRASALGRIPLTVPANVVGSSTRTAVQSGASYGYAAQIDGLCHRIQEEIGPCHVYATGGLSELIAPISRQVDEHDAWLTLRGFALIAQRLGFGVNQQETS